MKYIGMYQFSKSDNFMKGKSRFTPNKEIADTICTNIKEGGVFMCVKKIGNHSPSGHNASSIVDKNGLAPTVMENHGTITAIIETKRYENYITWKDKQGKFNTECNRASLENDLSLTIPTNNITKVAVNERERESNYELESLLRLNVRNLWHLKKKIMRR